MKMIVTPTTELLTWDSEFWNVRMARGGPDDIDGWARENMVRCMCLLIDGEDVEGAHRAEQNGARLMDVRVKLGRQVGQEPWVFHSFPPMESKAVTRPANRGENTAALAEVDSLAAIARTAFRGMTRFYADPRLPDERCDDLYETWLRSSVAGWAAEVLMVGDGDGPAGFVTIHVEEDEASIGLIAVAEHVRGWGVGANLTRAAVDWAWRQKLSRMTVVTQGRNVAAQRTFQRCGFRTESSDLWFHRWIDE